jgi:hypothetical protein
MGEQLYSAAQLQILSLFSNHANNSHANHIELVLGAGLVE